jgi:hypothetical protein
MTIAPTTSAVNNANIGMTMGRKIRRAKEGFSLMRCLSKGEREKGGLETGEWGLVIGD